MEQKTAANTKSFSGSSHAEQQDLRGPNSSITTIMVYPKWEKIEAVFLKPLGDWQGFPNKLCQYWVYRESADLVSGLIQRQAEYNYGEYVPSELILDVQTMKFWMQSANPELLLENWEFNALRGRPGLVSDANFVIGFKAGSGPEGYLSEGEALGTLNLSCVLWELKAIDAILIGASLHKPIHVKQLDTSDTLKYNPERNPTTEGFHIFENEYLSIAVQHRAFRGVFTQIESYSEDFCHAEHSELIDVKYYGRPAVPDAVKAVQKAIQELYYESPSRRDRRLYEGQDAKADAALRESLKTWSDKYALMKGRLEKLKASVGKLQLSPQELVKYLYLSFIIYDLYIDLRLCRNGKDAVGKYRVTLPERRASTDSEQNPEVRLICPEGSITIKALTRTNKSHATRKASFEQQYLVEINRQLCFTVNYDMGYKYGMEAPVGYSYYSLRDLGRVVEYGQNMQPALLLEAFFDARALLEHQHMLELSQARFRAEAFRN